ncbi:MAG TPA: UdgX family uracil-DNA binding protein [Nocardioides sp.]|uniref:UdgX family uracil-DNA binding protein n=1 Tax=Nocardioides sp. TaxID=35761 RepID=UPI002F3F5CFC
MATSASDRPERPGAQEWVPERLGKKTVAAGIDACRGCELYRDATHGVPGDGPLDAAVMLVGEQPGDQEDRQGKPFVGPAGRLLDRALEDAGVDPGIVFRTNAVKHFRWDPGRGGKRIHKGPSRVHVTACGPWLVAELDLVRPRGVVLLGAIAGAAVFGPSFRVGPARGHPLDWPDGGIGSSWTPSWAVATTHPSAVLRSRQRHEDYAALVADLEVAASLLSADS